jgi:hypothetical protein
VKVVSGGAAKTFLDVGAITNTSAACARSRSRPTTPRAGSPTCSSRARGGALQVYEHRRSAADPDAADPASRRLVISIPHTEAGNHNGGQLQFGPTACATPRRR